MRRVALACALTLLTACGGASSPVQPSGIDFRPVTPLILEAEAGESDGVIRVRSNASGGRTVHLAPGERLRWAVPVGGPARPYAISITYSNGRWGPREVVMVLVNGSVASAFEARETGEDNDIGWNAFVADSAGTATLGATRNTIEIVTEGGDGCVEIDSVLLIPAGAL